jgi:uncharacterized protein
LLELALTHWLLLPATALIGGMANALAGGGTFLVFPALLLTGLDPIFANATSAATMLPGGAASAWVYRKGSQYSSPLLRGLILASIAGGIVGSVLVLLTPSDRFARLVPYLMLGATLVFTFAKQLTRAATPTNGAMKWTPLWIGHFLISVYGGYFGAGMGVLMIVLFALTAKQDVQQSAALRFYCTLGINGPAVAIFAFRQVVAWQLSIPMALAAISGGFLGARLVRRLAPETARRAVLAYAWAITLWLLLR